MKKTLKILTLTLLLTASSVAMAQTPPPVPTCPALEKLNAGSARTKDCSTITDTKRKCKCEADNVRILALYEIRKQEAQFRCEMRDAKKAINDTAKTTKASCT
ncbi:MAG: hypothetical protein SFT90_04030 [Rickettsiales bacterium]|nr:hypothetical protein [Rickettsiales bacterium]